MDPARRFPRRSTSVSNSLIEPMEPRYLLALAAPLVDSPSDNTPLITAAVDASYASFADVPELPRVYLDTTYVPGAGNIINVPVGGNVQNAINSAQLGDTILLAAGATFTGNFTLPNRTTGSGWITIRTSAPDSSLPAPGTRITPAYASVMPKLVSANNNAALATQNGAHHYRFIGVEFTIASSVGTNNGIVVLGSGSQTSAQTPHNLIFDRVYIHGTPTAQVQNGMRLNSASTAVIDSWFENCQATAFESHNIGGYNGPGPYKLVNNTFSGATIPVIFGGAATSVSGLIPSDMEIRGNHFTRPLSWRPGDPSYAGTAWYVKNLFELKNGQRVLFDGNVLEHNWPQLGTTPDGSPQHGYAILLTVRAEGGNVPWATVADITLTNNIIRKSNVGISISGTEGQGTKRILLENNLFDDIGLNWGNNDRSGMFMQAQTVGDLIINHNTIINDGDIIFANGVKTADLVFTNNIVNHNAARTINNNRGINAPGTAVGNASLAAKFFQYEVTKNAMANAAGFTASYPSGNFFPSNFSAVGFSSLAARDYRLAPASAYRNAGTDGKDLGADFDALNLATAGSISGVWAPPTVSSISRVGPASTYAASASWTVTFSGTVTGVDAADFILAASGVSGAAITSVTGSDSVYTVTASTGSGDGTLGLNLVDDDSILDLVGNRLGGAGTGNGNFTGQVYSVLRANPAFTGTSSNDRYFVRRDGADLQVLTSAAGFPVFIAPFSTVESLTFITGVGADTLFLDHTAGDPIPAGGISFDAGSGFNAISVIGTASAGNVTIVSGSVTLASATNLSLTINAGAVLFIDGPQELASLSLPGGTALLSPDGGNTLQVTSLSITANGRLDLADNAMVINYPASTTSPIDTIRQYLFAGRNGGVWNGLNGIQSSTAAADGRAFAYAEASALGDLSTWAGQPADAASVILKYTLPGDANFSGTINPDDHALFDRGRARSLTGWINGDFNYDNLINEADQALLNGTVAIASPTAAPALAPVSESPQTTTVGTRVILKTTTKPSVRYTWRVHRNGKLIATGTGATRRFTPAAAGRYTITLNALDKKNGKPLPKLRQDLKLVVKPRPAKAAPRALTLRI